MDNSFFAYMQQLELMAFFSGYPLVYSVILYIAENQKVKNNLKIGIDSLLPFAYAFVGTLYLGFLLRKLYPDYSVENIKLLMQQPWLMIWGLLSIAFWIPALGKKKVLSLIHSLVFFFFLVKDLLLKLFISSTNNDIVSNDMKTYANSIFLNLAAFVFIMLVSLTFIWYKKNRKS